jgi:hypothetical protein
LAGIVSSTTAPGDTTVLWLDTAATAVGVDLDEWTDYTPTWTASTTNPVLNNGSIIGRYKQIGKTMFFTIKLTIGSTTTFGSGAWRFTLPATAQGYSYQFPVAILDNGTAWYQAMAVGDYAGSTSYFSVIVNTTNAPSVAVESSVPMTWATTDTLTVSGTYEVA